MYTREKAEAKALEVLAWLVGDEELLPIFLGSTGLSEDDLRTRVGEADLLGAVLDFLMMDDAWVQRACDGVGLNYDSLTQMRATLPGGEQVHWT